MWWFGRFWWLLWYLNQLVVALARNVPTTHASLTALCPEPPSAALQG
jgi:hypothetical protein